MIGPWNPGSHAVQFYESEAFIHNSISEFFTQGVDPGGPCILVSRYRTFTAIAPQLVSGRHSAAVDTADHIQFIDAETVLPQIMDGETLRQDRAERLFNDVLLQARPTHASGTVRLYGEIVDILCQYGHHAAALQFEGLASLLLKMEPRLSILCGYALDRFNDDAKAAQFRAICQKHTDVISAKGLGHHEPAIYVIDDNATLRRAIGRLLASSNWPIRTFDTAEAFQAELEKLSSGCLVVDVQLPGMSGFDLIRWMTDTGLSWPIIVMSGLQDEKTEHEALRSGARAFLRKPFTSKSLLDAVARAFL